MNIIGVLHILGLILNFEALFMLLPALVALIYGEPSGIWFLIVAFGSAIIGLPLTKIKWKVKELYAREGFAIVALSWILLSIIGALPFCLSGSIPSFTDALFETISGFTTTGASILTDVEALPNCMLFWRSFTHWIGGMGVLVFIMAIVPLAGGQNIHLMRAESTGPQVGKLVPRLGQTAKILYGIYISITLAEVLALLISGMNLFEAFTLSFGTVGTGGFGILNSSIASYTGAQQTIITVFMIICGVNFNVYFLLLMGKPKSALKCEEMRWYLGIIFVSIILITINVRGMYGSFYDAFHHSSFQVASIITTTGYGTVPFNEWPAFSKTILWLLMFCGACAGSTGGGMKVSRILILFKSLKRELNNLIHPRAVKKIRFEGKVLESGLRSQVLGFVGAFFVIFFASVLIVSIEGYDFETNVTAVTATINNIGPGFSLVNSTSNFSFFSPLSKYVMMFDMLVGRLEVYPMMIILFPGTWKKQ